MGILDIFGVLGLLIAAGYVFASMAVARYIYFDERSYGQGAWMSLGCAAWGAIVWPCWLIRSIGDQ